MLELVAWLTSLPLSLTIQRTSWVIPVTQIIHILAIAMVMSSVIMMDLRVWGYSRYQTLAQSAHRFGPWIWTAMVPLIATGIVLILAAPRRTLLDPAFQVKMLLMTVAIVLTIALHRVMRHRDAASPGRGAGVMLGIMAGATMALWIAVTFAGRGRWMVNFLR